MRNFTLGDIVAGLKRKSQSLAPFSKYFYTNNPKFCKMFVIYLQIPARFWFILIQDEKLIDIWIKSSYNMRILADGLTCSCLVRMMIMLYQLKI